MESIRSTGKHFRTSNFLRLIHLEIFLKKILACCQIQCTESRSCSWRHKSEDKSDKWRQTKLWHNSNADFCVEADDYQFYNTCRVTAELCGRTAETADVGITIRQIPYSSSFLAWTTRFKTQVSNGSDFPSKAMLWIKEVEMVDSMDE